LSPLRFGVASFFSGGFSFEPLTFWVCLFFLSEVFLLSPLHFGVASLFIRDLSFEPLVFWVYLLFIRSLSFEPLAFWGFLFFHRRSFFLSPLQFGFASFFIGGLSFLAPCILALSVFFAPARYRVVKITHSSSKMVL
jgi:hypothetical protein